MQRTGKKISVVLAIAAMTLVLAGVASSGCKVELDKCDPCTEGDEENECGEDLHCINGKCREISSDCGGSTCKDYPEACSSNSECCSDFCSAGKCQPGSGMDAGSDAP